MNGSGDRFRDLDHTPRNSWSRATKIVVAGFDQVECDSYTPTILLGGGGNLDDSVDFLLGGGMPRGLLGLVDPSDRMTWSESSKPNSPIDTKRGSGSAFGRRRGWPPPRHSRLTCSAMTKRCQSHRKAPGRQAWARRIVPATRSPGQLSSRSGGSRARVSLAARSTPPPAGPTATDPRDPARRARPFFTRR